MKSKKLILISIDDKWPTKDDADSSGKIWVYRPASMTKWDRTGTLFKITLEQYIVPLELEIKHFTNFEKTKFTKLEYTESSRTAHNNRIQWPYWMPGHIIMEPQRKDSKKKVIISSKFPVVKGHLSVEEYNKITKK